MALTGRRIHELVDDLARRAVMGEWDESPAGDGSASEIAGILRAIGDQAAAAGCCAVVEAAADLERAVAGAVEPQSLEDGIRRLQEVVSAWRPPGDEEPASPSANPVGAQPACLDLAQDPELLSEFIVESREHLASIENQVLALEQDPVNHDALHAAFRGFHTIKGLAGFLDLTVVREISHEVESLLDIARSGGLAVTPPVIDAVLAGADFLKSAIQGVEDGLHNRPSPPLPDHRALLARVEEAARHLASGAAVAEGGEQTPPPSATQPAESVTDLPCAAPQPAVAVQAAKVGETHTVKVNTSKLDHLVDMVGELVITQSLLRHDPDMAAMQSQRLQRNISQLGRITTDVQRTAMSMRMVPVGQLFRRMARLVRDLGRKECKQVELVTSGDETELDRNIVEELADPLMHMIRNAIGHGLETPDERREAEKPAMGRLSLSAYHQACFIVIELSDDGRGLNREKILAKARERGLVHEGAQLTEQEVHALIFEPGFSTATVVNDVSGRGVGMDVVKRNIQKLRGRVDIASTLGVGTTFTMKMPLTLAIIDGLVVGVGTERYIVPIYTVREMLRPGADAVSTVHNRDEMVQVRGQLLPVVRLHRRFGVTPRSEDPTQSLLLVTESLGKRFCLMVDDLIGKQEVVIKSLGEALKNVPGIAGGAILGDGHVGLILDVDGLFGAQSHV